MFIFYKNSPTIQKATNSLLTKLPGPVGRYFEKVPTESENEKRIEYLAEYFLEEDPGVAADKMYIIKKEDEKVYRSIVREMNLTSPEKTEEIIVKIRDLELRKDLLISVYDDVREDEKNKFRSEISRIESQDLLISKLEIEKKFANKEFQAILKGMSPEGLAKVLYFVDLDVKSYVVELFDNQLKSKITKEINRISLERENLKDIAKYYETKNLSEALEDIGNEGIYDMERLAVIYSNMSISKSSQMLSQMEDSKFIEELFLAIKREEELTGKNINMAGDISRSIEFFSDYNEKIAKLRKVYGDMSAGQVASITKKMIKNDRTITIFNLDVDEIYDLSDKTIIIDILSGMKREQLSKVLDSMDSLDASEVTQLLATPEEKIFKGGERLDDGRGKV